MINNIYQEFLRNCKNTKDVYSKGNLVEKDELIRSINNIAKNEFKWIETKWYITLTSYYKVLQKTHKVLAEKITHKINHRKS